MLAPKRSSAFEIDEGHSEGRRDLIDGNAQTEALLEIARKLVLMEPQLDVMQQRYAGGYSDLAHIIEEQIKKSEARGKLLLPDLSSFGNQTVAIFSDYGGETSSNYRAYSTLVCGHNNVEVLTSRMREVRVKHGLGTKEIAFKDFGMGQIQRALPEYLEGLDLVPGFLFTTVVDTKIRSLFGPGDRAHREQISEIFRSAGLVVPKDAVAEKALRVTHQVAFLSALLACNGQNLFWMSDHDAIVPNEAGHKSTLELFQRLLEIYGPVGRKYGVIGGATPFEVDEMGFKDLLSSTDVVAGVITKYLTDIDRGLDPWASLKSGADKVLDWLCHEGLGLKKMTIVIRQGDNGVLHTSTLDFHSTEPMPSDVIVLPIPVKKAGE